MIPPPRRLTFRVLASSLALSSTAVLAGAPPAAVAAARYSSGANPLDQVAKMADPQLAQQIVGLAKQLQVTKVERVGKEAKTLWAPVADAALGDMARTERIAALAQLQRAGAQGAESDFLIGQPDGTRVPVTVTWELSGELTLRSGAAVKELLSGGAKAEEIAAKYHLDPFVEDGVAWAPLELAAVEKALSLLTPDELALVQGLGFRRKGNDIAGRFAFYRRADDGMTIDVFNKAFSLDKDYFIGSVDAPMSASVSTLVHEIAHAMSDFHGRQKAIVANKAVADARAAQARTKADPSDENKKAMKELSKAAADLRSANNAQDKVMLSRGRAAERAFAAVVDPKVSVSTYGRTSVDENLAEGFVLFKLDGAALERVGKPAVEWFKAGTFAREAGKPLE